MSFGFGQMIEILKKNPKTIVFTEGTDSRILEAASRLLAGNFLHPILVGNEDEVIKAAVKLVQDTITRIGGTVDKVDEWGKRHLAYEVRHQSEGYYVVVDFQADPAEIKELDRVIKIHEEIIRHIIVKQDD